MRYRLMASYQGSPFEAGIGPTDSDIVLFAACPPPEELGFEPATGHWRKQLSIQDVQAVWESRPVGIFRGERCMVLDDLGERLHIGYLGHDAYKAEQLGYWQVDRGVFELVAPRTEVSEILEERSDYPRAPASGGLASEHPAPGSGYPHSGSHPVLPSPPAGLSGPQAGLSGAQPIISGQPTLQPEATGFGEATWPVEPTRSTLSGQHAVPSAYQAQDLAGGTPAYRPPGSAELYPELPEHPQGPYAGPLSYPPTDVPMASSATPAAYAPLLDDTTGVALPVTAEAPLPLEAEAMRAASASRRPRQSAARQRNAMAPVDRPAPVPAPGAEVPAPLAAAMQAPAPGMQASPARAMQASPAAAPESQAVPGFPTGLASEPGLSGEPGFSGEPGRARAAAEPVEPVPGGPQYVAPLYVVPDPVSSPTALDVAQPGLAQPGLAQPGAAQPGPAHSAVASRQRRAARRRMATERLFADLASQAGIPPDTYAVGEEVEGAMCLIETDDGFEVFHSADGARHELQVFATEESACFYLFGVLAAEAVRTGSLVRLPATRT